MKFPPPVIAQELEIFEKVFKESVKSHVSLLDTIMRYIVKRKGKQLRPMFVLLSAKLTGQINDQTYRAALAGGRDCRRQGQDLPAHHTVVEP